MITIINKRYNINSYLFLNTRKLRCLDALRIVTYNNYIGVNNFTHKFKAFFFFKRTSYTINIDLTRDEEQIFKDFKSNTRNEIKKAAVAQCRFVDKISTERFVDFYNDFASKKNLRKIDYNACTKYGDNIIITGVEVNNEILTMHAYFIDRQEKLVTLLYSASKRLEDNCNSDLLKLIGYSNRYLHYQDMIYFKRNELNLYDFGGVYIGDKDKSQMGIANFKKSFGGDVVQKVDYMSFLYRVVLKYFHK